MKNKGEKKKGASVLLIIIIVLAAGIFCFAGYKLITIYLKYHAATVSYDNIKEVVHSGGENSFADPDPDAADYKSAKPDKFEYEDEYDEGMTYDYQALLAINPDTIGYIKARGDGMIVDYPVVQAADNDYYLTRMFDGTYNAAGSIFMDCDAVYRFNSPYCIIYGHNMASGSRMFGYLKQYEKEAYFNSHLEYDIYTPYEHYVYKVIAAYKTDTYSLTYEAPVLYNSVWMTTDEVKAALVEIAEHAISLSKYKTDFNTAEIKADSRLIALSTCYGDYSDPNRFIVLLIRDRIVIPRESGTSEIASE